MSLIIGLRKTFKPVLALHVGQASVKLIKIAIIAFFLGFYSYSVSMNDRAFSFSAVPANICFTIHTSFWDEQNVTFFIWPKLAVSTRDIDTICLFIKSYSTVPIRFKFVFKTTIVLLQVSVVTFFFNHLNFITSISYTNC